MPDKMKYDNGGIPLNEKPRHNNRLLKYFGRFESVNKIRSMPNIGYFRVGCLAIFGISSVIAYYCYKTNKEFKYLVGESLEKFSSYQPLPLNDMTWSIGNKENLYLRSIFLNLDRKIFKQYSHRAAYVTGYFDHNKEIHVSKTRNGERGYDVITPFYYYDIEHYGIKNEDMPKDFIIKGAIVVNRGW